MWLYNGKEWQPPEDFDSSIYYGFVYLITNEKTDQKYIGKKFFWSKKTLGITKKRKRKKKLLVESDWKDYFGSNRLLNEEIIDKGNTHFKREILHLCKSRGECAYMEAKEQFDRDVLLTDEYYNGIIACKIGAPSVKNLKK